MSITANCMIVNLNIGVWVGQRRDKEAARRITEDAGAETDSASVNKHLVPKSTLDPIVTAASALRTHFYDNTLPWKDNGDRLLVRARYTKFIEQHEKLSTAFKDAVETFINTTYISAREQAAFRMGDLFKSQDYPEPWELRRKFYVNLDIDAVTEAGDFRVALDNDALDQRRKQIEDNLNQRLSAAMHNVWERLAEIVGRYARMGDEKARLHSSTVDALTELVEVLPELNVLGDPNLNEMCQRVKDTLVGYDVQTLRQDKAARSVVAGEAQKIMDTMKGFMAAFGGDE